MVSNIVRSPSSQKNSTTTSWPRSQDEALDKAAIAEIPTGLFSQMSREELIRVIRASELPLVDARTLERFQYLDRATLQRLAHLARRCCRNQGY
jgi:hypothetical protein